VFPNRGTRIGTSFIKTIRDQQGANFYESKVERKAALDPRVAYLVLNMLQEVLCCGTGAGVRSQYDFRLPAAGKTGTSRDGWFAGFTSKLICVVWVGFDDGRDFKLEGAHSALPIWAEFMKRAHQHREYRGVRGFDAPEGVVTAQIDAESGQLAGAGCTSVKYEVFIAGTQPVEVCRMHGGAGGTQIAGWEPTAPPPPAESTAPERQRVASNSSSRQVESKPVRSITITPQQAPAQQPDKKGFWGRIKDIFK
jgi:penicillin-binding protein 1B